MFTIMLYSKYHDSSGYIMRTSVKWIFYAKNWWFHLLSSLGMRLIVKTRRRWYIIHILLKINIETSFIINSSTWNSELWMQLMEITLFLSLACNKLLSRIFQYVMPTSIVEVYEVKTLWYLFTMCIMIFHAVIQKLSRNCT